MGFNTYYHKQNFRPDLLSILINPFYLIRNGLYRGVKKHAQKLSGNLLDFGCGSKPYRDLFQVETYTGMDIDNRGHDHVNENIDVYYDGKVIPFDNNHFDAVFSSEVFEHVDNLDEIVGEIHRVMKPGAKLLVTVPFVWCEHEMPYDFRRFSRNGIQKLLMEKGFEIEEADITTSDVATVFQMICMYIYTVIMGWNKYIRLLLNPLIIFPFTFLGLFLSVILPNTKRFYCNVVVTAVAKK